MINLIGTYEAKTDAKGRVMMPVAFKKQLLSVLDGDFVLKRSMFQPCLELYPMQEWEKVMGQVSKLNRFNKKNNDFIRRLTAGVKVLNVDASGRVLLAKDLVSFAGIKKDVVLSSSISFIEIWDKDAYESAVADEDGMLADLAEEVMGNVNLDADGIS
ncbi:MAG: division/cell wall cluster transcriptional repressor MraZ [Flavobacteriaceae bacterium]